MKMYIVLVLFVCSIVGSYSAGIPQDGISEDSEDRLFESFPIVPGTKWCGNGNISNSEEDLGLVAKTDKCCRAHDMCPDGISAGKYKHGLHNTGLYTRSHCDCDTEFYNCLKEAGNALSVATGTTYFTVLGPQCFKKEHPITECHKKRLGRCVEYSFDDKEEPVYQWFDNPTFQ